MLGVNARVVAESRATAPMPAAAADCAGSCQAAQILTSMFA
jgi:hypothetical protein